LQDNFVAFRSLVESIELHKGKAGVTPEGFHMWDAVSWELLSPFFSSYAAQTHTCLALHSGKSLLQTYIESVHKHGDLSEWTVVVMSSKRGDVVWDGKPYRTVSRQRLMDDNNPQMPEDLGIVAFQSVAMGADEGLDLSKFERDTADSNSQKFRSRAAAYRASRPSTRGLLLVYPIIPTTPTLTEAANQSSETWKASKLPFVIGIAVSLPNSKFDSGCDYVCNKQKLREIFGSLADDLERDAEEDGDILVANRINKLGIP
jgi:hypothetical protein